MALHFEILQDLYRELIEFLPVNRQLSRMVCNALLLRLISMSHFFAFTSLYVQIQGLSGQNGLMPVLGTLNGIIKNRQVWKFSFTLTLPQCISLILTKIAVIMTEPSALSDECLLQFLFCSSVVSTIGIFLPCSAVFIYLFLSYYSVMRVTAQHFVIPLDTLLLESSLSAVLLAVALSLQSELLANLCNWLFKLLIFRVMLGSGYIKLICGNNFSLHENLMKTSFRIWSSLSALSTTSHRISRVAVKSLMVGIMFIPFALLVYTPSIVSGSARYLESLAVGLCTLFIVWIVLTSRNTTGDYK
jgi:hypothetical protein